MKKGFLLIVIVLFVFIGVYAQSPPSITYTTPQVYTAGTVITPLLPANTGGAVFPANYNTPTVFASYLTPFSMATDGSNNVYTTNNTTGDLTKFDAAGDTIFTINTGNIQASEIAVDGLGNMYVSQFTSSTILKYGPTGMLLATIPGFADPYGIAFDASNNAYIADFSTGSIFTIKAGASVASVYLTGFNTPYGIIMDSSGNIYVSEEGPGDIIKIAANSLARTTFASGFNGPRHLNKDGFDNIYVADYGNNAIKRISPAGVITPVISAGVTSPRQVAFDSSGNLFVANYGNNTLLKFSATSYAINAALPAGLIFNTATGQISGTPTTPAPAKVFAVTAYNTGGTGMAQLSITVGATNSGPPAPSDVTLTPSAIATAAATLNGLAQYDGSPTVVSFTYGTNPNLVNATTTIATTNSSLSAGNNTNSTLVLTGLTPLTTYYYRITSVGSSGTTIGSIVSFVTLPSSNASLSGLSISSGGLSPAFSAGKTAYTASVSNAIASVTITPAASDVNATLTVNGAALTSGNTSPPVALNVGPNTITTVVTAQDGTIQTYTITVNRAAALSSNAALAGLSISNGNLSPAFAGTTTGYTANVSNAIASVTITPAASDVNATLTVNGTTLTSGNTSPPVALNAGANTITTVVTAQDGTIQTYTITVNRAAALSSNAALAGLSISNGSLSPAFTSATTGYTANVSSATSSLTVTSVTSDPTATVTVNGASVSSGSASGPIALNVGANAIAITAVAADGITTQTYNITVNRASPVILSSNAVLSNLSVTGSTLSPAFAAGTQRYTTNVNNAVTSVSMTPVTGDPNATVTVNGITLISGAVSAPIALSVGANIITATVTAQDGTTTDTYTLTINRASSSNANLARLTTTAGALKPGFSSNTTNYTLGFNYYGSSIAVTPATSDPDAIVTVNGATVAPAASSASIPLTIGLNTINVVVTASDGITTKTYKLTVTRLPSNNANLALMMLSSGQLSPALTPANTSYTAIVTNAVSSITVEPVATDPTATMVVNGIPIASWATSPAISLNVGNNIISTVITAADGTTVKTYTITVNRALSNDANLVQLGLSSGTLSPAFAASKTNYSANVGNSVKSITVTPTTSDVNATVSINGATSPSGSASQSIPLTVGSNTITAQVTAPDGKTTKTYTLTVTRASLSNANLANLKISGGVTISPAFASGITSYTSSINNTVRSVKITPITSDPGATVTVNGNAVTSGTLSNPVSLSVGSNVITTAVTAPDGITIKIYRVAITRAPSSNSNLASLHVSNGSLSPQFSPVVNGYTASVTNGVKSITVTPTTTDPGATVTINGANVTSGTPSTPVSLFAGPNTIVTTVTAQDGTTSKTYTLTVTRAPSSNANLAKLYLSNGTLSPAFSTGINGYTAAVNNGIKSVNVTPTTTDPMATVTVNGTVVTSGTASTPIALNVGANTIITTVTAQDGTTVKTYKVIMTRAPSSNANLANLRISNGTLSPSFSAGNTGYTASVNNSIKSITVTPTTMAPTATVSVNGVPVTSGTPSNPVSLSVGSNTVTASVIAQDGTTIQTYKIIVTRAPSSNANLANLRISNGTMSPAFSAGINGYAASVNNGIKSIKVTPVTADPNSTVTVNGTAVTSGAASTPVALNMGTNTITTIVTAQDGTTSKTYTLTITRVTSSNANLAKLYLSNGTLSPAFSAGINGYTAAVNNGIKSVNVTPTTTDPMATVTVNGTVVTSGTASTPIALNVGANTIITTVTAQDGTTVKTYKVIMTRAPSSNANLANLRISNGTLSPSFSAGNTGYTASVNNSIKSITVTPTTMAPAATVSVNGVPVTSGTPSNPVSLSVGSNTVTASVIAQDGTTIQTYKIIVTRAPSSNANLANLRISNGTMSPAFSAGINGYTASVNNGIKSIKVTPVTADPNATVTVNGTAVTSGAASTPVALNIGPNTITTIVTAQNGTTSKTYTLTITRVTSSNANLAKLYLSNGTLSPAFSTGINGYTAAVNNGIKSVNVTPTTTDPMATVTVNGTVVTSGTASTPIALNVGANTIITTVTAQDGTTVKTYKVIMTRAPSSNANLANLRISNGTLSPSFSAGNTGYTASVNNSIKSITVTPTTMAPTATVSVNGVPVTSGTPSNPVSLSVGSNTVTASVIAQDGTTIQTYKIIVTRAPSSNANLANLRISNGTMSPAFSAGINGYAASVNNGIKSIKVTPVTADPNSTVTVNGTAVTSGAASTPVALNMGTNTITTIVTAQDGTTSKTYTLTITRVTSSNANLAKLYLSNGTLSPAFSAGINGYTAAVNNGIKSVNVTPTTTDPMATVTVNGTVVTSGTASTPIALNVGANTIITTVTAQDGTTVKTYKVIMTRAPSSNANLANLRISNGTLSPSFSAGNTGYTASVNNSIKSITVTPTTMAPTATVSVNGVPVTSGTPSNPVSLSVGSNTVTASVIAQDGTTIQTYKIVITRAPSSNANLANLRISNGTLSPAFSAGINGYTATVNNGVKSIKVTPVTTDPNAIVTVNGTAVTSGTASNPVILNIGLNTIVTTVTAQDGATSKTYTLTITRASSSNANLANLRISNGTLSPAFSAIINGYTASVTNAIKSVNVTPTTTDAMATVTVNGTVVTSGTASTPIALNVGANTIITTVTAQDGTTVKTYKVIMTRAPSSNANLANLRISNGTLSPSFSAGNTGYTASVNNSIKSITVTPTTMAPAATVSVNGVPVTSGTPSNPVSLSVGSNTVTASVIAQDGTTIQTYKIIVTRAPSSNANLANLRISNGTMSPAFSAGINGYTASVNNGIKSIKVTPVTADPNATVTVNGTAVTSGAASTPVALNIGPNTITTIVTAQNGTASKTYTLIITRAPSSNANLANLRISNGTLSPAFSAGINGYTAAVNNGIKSVNVTPTTTDPNATVTVNGTVVTSGTASTPIALNVGANTIITTVTAQDGTTVKTYKVIMTRAPSSNANLANLHITNGSLSPVFASGTSSYTSNVAGTVAFITVTPTTSDPTATVTINGTAVTSGTASVPIALVTGPNTITTAVTAQDGTTIKYYTITVNQAALSNNAALSDLSTSSGNLNPTFASGTNRYASSVPNNITSITVTPTTSDANATVNVNGIAVVSGTASQSLPLNTGANIITTAVTAQDGTTVQTYTIIVTRAASSNALLSNLTTSNGSLSPTFSTGTNSYIVYVPNTVSFITLTPTASDSTATAAVNGTPVTSGKASIPIALNVGADIITTAVTAQDGITVAYYTVTVIRAATALSNNDMLSDLSISSGSLNPVFATGTNSYTANVANSITSITIMPTTSDANATVTVNGVAVTSGTTSQSIPLNVGDNTLTTTVVAQNGLTTQNYIVVVTRAASSNAMLSSLSTSNGTLSPVFASGTTSYTTSVPSNVAFITVTPTTSDPAATVTVNGTAVTSATASIPIALNAGTNTITTAVTAADGVTVQYYTLTVTQSVLSNNAALSGLSTSSGSLSPVFASGTTSYTTSVPSNVAFITVTPTTSDPAATVTVNGTAVTSATASIPIALNAGTNTITTAVTAADGVTVQYYSLTVTQSALSNNAALSGLSTSSGSLSPVFASGTTSYTTSVPSNVAFITVTPTTSDPAATVTVNGTAVTSATASIPIALNAGTNTITTAVTAADGVTVQYYTLTVTQSALSNNAALSGLSTSSGSLSPVFASGTTSYTVNLTNNVTNITVTPTAADPTATITVNGAAVASNTASTLIALNVGPNIITTAVAAADGTTIQYYTIMVTRAALSDATLSSLTTSSASLSPAFASATTGYTATVSNNIPFITITPTSSDPTATITVNGTATASGTASTPIALNIGPNIITTAVTASDGTTIQYYSVTITRGASSDASLSNLSISNGSLSPVFASNQAIYSASVTNDVAFITAIPTASDPSAMITVNGAVVTSGTASIPFALNVGPNILTTAVIATDGVTIQYYTVIVIRASNVLGSNMLSLGSHQILSPVSGQASTNFITTNKSIIAALTRSGPSGQVLSANAKLAALKISRGKLTPAFSQSTFSYTVTVDSTVSNIKLTPLLSDANATLYVNGSALPGNSKSTSIALKPGIDTIVTKVIAPDGKTVQLYTTIINREKLDSAPVENAMADDVNKIMVHQAVSPNGDGINDFLVIDGIESYPENKVEIIDRNGATVYNVSGYNNANKVFDGHSNINGRLQQPGTYFYIIEYTVNGEVRRKTGYLVLKF